MYIYNKSKWPLQTHQTSVQSEYHFMEKTGEGLKCFVPCATLHRTSSSARNSRQAEGQLLYLSSRVMPGPPWGDMVLRVGLMLILGAGMKGAWYILGSHNRIAYQVGSSSKLLRSDCYRPTLPPQHRVDMPPGCPGGL